MMLESKGHPVMLDGLRLELVAEMAKVELMSAKGPTSCSSSDLELC